MILQINKMYTPDIGGVETVVQEYARYLQEHDEVIVLCVNKHFSLKTKVEIIEGIKVYRCASFGTFMSMPISIVFYFYLFFLLRKATHIHIHEPFPLASVGSFLIPSNKKLFITWHSDIIKQKNIKKFFEFFQKRLCKKANKIIATSDNLINFSGVLQEFKDKVQTIPLSINKDEYLKKLNCENILNDLPKNYVLFLGRLSYYKGIFVLLEAIEKINEDISFLIVGSGELADDIKEKIKRSQKSIYFINRFVTDEEKKCLLKNSKFMVFPSIYPSEAFGILQLESMVYGRPVINTNLPTGVPWVSVVGISGLTVEPFDSLSLAENIEQLYFDEFLYEKLSLGAIERLENNFITNITDNKLHQLYFGEDQ